MAPSAGDKPADVPSEVMPNHGTVAAQSDLLQIVLDSLTHPFYVINAADYRIRLANRTARQMYNSGGATCYALSHGCDTPCDLPDHPCPLKTIVQTGRPAVVEHVHCDGQGQLRNVEVRGFPILAEDGNVTEIIEYCIDVTEQRQMAERHQWELDVNKALAGLADALIDPAVSIKQIADLVLDQARRLTESKHGYVSSMDPDTGDMVAHTLTHMMGRQCHVPPGQQSIVFHRNPDGSFPALFGHALNTGQGFYTEAPRQHPASTGLPPGHIPLKNFLTVPALVGDKVVGQIAMANSKRAYGDRDLRALERMAKVCALAIQQRRVERALKNSEERYALAQKAANIGSWDWNIVTGDLVWSERIEPMFGFALGQFKGTYEAFLECVHPDDRPSVVDSVNACIEHEKEYHAEHRIVWPDGTIRWLSETGDVIRDASGKAVRMLGVVRDITEYKETERKVLNLAKFASENPSPVLRVRGDGVILYANRPGQTLLNQWNTKPGQAISEDWDRQIADVLTHDSSRIVEVECQDRVFSLVLVPVAGADYVNIYGRDVTEQKRAQREIRELNERLELRVLERTAQLAKANEQLREQMEQRWRLEQEILDISEREQRRIGQELHDSLGQQLTGIAIITKVLEQKLERQSLEEATTAREIAQLVNEAVSQTRQLSRGLHPVGLDEHGLMTALQTLADRTQNVFGVACAFHCSKAVKVKNTSVATHLYRIAQEAVTNAIRHGETGHISLTLTDGPARAILTIENDGRDFPAEPPKGTGMGLYMMQHRAEMIGGVLTVQRRAGGGTTVTCLFDTEPQADNGESQDAG